LKLDLEIAMSQRHILIVEDDAKIADMMANYLRAQGHVVDIVANGLQGVEAVKRLPPDLLLLDLMLPGLDGMEVCRQVRAFSQVPIIMVTARIDEIDRLLGLEIGADDYVCKPFSPRELAARVKALLRRSDARGGLLPSSTKGFVIHEEAQRLVWNSGDGTDAVPLTPVEFRLFKTLASRPGVVFSRAKLLDVLHADFRDVSDRAIDSHIKNLRRKLDAFDNQGICVASVYGVGYRYEPSN
jgi:two-component system, OmpR family, response regulator BaeR